MKILVVGNEPGGMYRFRIDLIRELKKDNCITVLVPNGEYVLEMIDEGCGFIDTPVDRRGINPIKDFKLLCLYNSIIKKEKPDFVITYTIKPNIYCGLVCERYNIGYSANITGLGTIFQNNGIIKKAVTFLYKKSLKKAKTVFFENSENRDLFVKEKIVKKNKTCVLNGAGVNTDYFYLSEYPNYKKTIFLFIGRIMKEKGFDEILTAMRKLVADGYQVELHVVGFYEESYEKEIEICKQEGWLVFKGQQRDVRPFIMNSNCFVLPSWHEGMANTNLECASMGRPVITSNIHGCLEAVENGVSGYLCEKKNADDLYEKMKIFLSHSYEQRKTMGLAGRKRMEELFDKLQVVEMTLNNLFK